MAVLAGSGSLAMLSTPAGAATTPIARPDVPASMAPKLLSGDVVAGLSSLLGQPHTETPSGTSLTIGVTVANPDSAAVQSFITSANDPRSSDYRHFLTPQQFDARFGPTPATVSAVSAWLTGGGLTVHQHADTPSYLTATGSVGQIGTLMNTSFDTVTSSGLIANTKAPTVPDAVLGVAGLNTGTHPRVTSDPVHKRAAASSGPGTRADSPPTGLLSPMDLWDIYNQPSNDTGQGQGLALFGYGALDDGAGHTVESDLRAFEAEYNLPTIPYYSSFFSSDPSETATEVDGFDEWTLDAQAADGMAPGAAKLVDYFATEGTDPDIIGSYAQWANDPNGPLQGSTSYGDCEDTPGGSLIYNGPLAGVLYLGNPAQDQYAAVYAQAAAEGRTLFAASGDTDACPTVAVALNGATPVPVPIQDYPGVDTNVVGVGGTVIYFNGKTSSSPASRIEDYPWPYSGGGQSHFITAPSQQASAIQPVTTAGTPAVAGVDVPVDPFTNLTDHHGTPYTTPQPARIQPDVAALSGDVTGDGYTICSSGVCDSFGAGTSLASPLWLGMWARVQAAEPANNQGAFDGVGFALPTIYRLAEGSAYLQNYYDVGSASETPPSVANSNGGGGTSPAEGGYDTQTGWGEPHLSTFITSATGSTDFTPTDPTGGAEAPGTPLPEAPLAALLPVVALLGGALILRRRRRAARG